MPESRQVLQCIVLFTNDDALELESRLVITFIREKVGLNLLRMKIKQYEEFINVTHKKGRTYFPRVLSKHTLGHYEFTLKD